MKQTLILILMGALVIGVLFAGMIIPSNENSKKNQQSLHGINTTISGERIHGYVGIFGHITIDSEFTPFSPATFPVYRGIQNEGDSFEIWLQTLGKPRQNVTSPQEADQAARRAMIPYGGIPADAVFRGAETTSIGERYNHTSGKVEPAIPLLTSVSYIQLINNRGVIGDSNWISLELGENGELLYVKKIWRTYTHIGDVPVITLDKAIQKLQNGETIESYVDDKQDVKISIMSLSYYAKNMANNETLLEPIWSFYGITDTGNSVAFNVYARQFANFTATPVSGTAPLTVRFTDTSDISPNQWFWDFGDGTNSTLSNPVHVYNSTGTYNVSLKVWNDLGSDTMEKPYYINVRTHLPTPCFTANKTIGRTPLAIQFSDSSSGNVTVWNWSFGDGSYSSLQNPKKTYTTIGNFTVNLTVWNVNGPSTLSKIDFIRTGFDIHEVTEVNSNSTITVIKDDVIRVNLSTNPSTGYQWFINTTNGLALTYHTYVPSDPCVTYPSPGGALTECMVGSGGYGVWDFQSISPEVQIISSIYKRSWIPDTGNERKFLLNVIVQPSQNNSSGGMGGSSSDSYTKSLLHFNGNHGSAQFYDETGLHNWSRHSNTAVIQSAPVKFGQGTLFIPGTGDHISSADSSDWAFGTGNFTIDAWVNINSTKTSGFYIWDQYANNNNRALLMLDYPSASSRRLVFYAVTGGTTGILLTAPSNKYMSLNTWHHVSVMRKGNEWSIWVDGEKVSSTVSSYTYPDLNSQAHIGMGYYDNAPITGAFGMGSIDELRVSKGISRWNGNFDTSLLTEY